MSQAFFRDTMPFLADLAEHNDRDWFEAHRDRYQAAYVDAAKAFVEAIAPRMAEVDPQVVCAPRINGTIRRINRDTRFSKDKTPYKTWLGLIFHRGDRRAGYVLRVQPQGLMIGGGRYDLDKPAIEAWRQRVDADGDAVAAVFAELWDHGFTSPEPELKRVPKPHTQDHPHGDLLRRKALIAGIDLDHPDDGLLDLVADHFALLRPLVDIVGAL